MITAEVDVANKGEHDCEGLSTSGTCQNLALYSDQHTLPGDILLAENAKRFVHIVPFEAGNKNIIRS